MRVRIQAYSPASRSARVLARTLGVRRARLVHTRFRPRLGDVVINWGSSLPLYPEGVYINSPAAVALAQNKHSTLALLREHNVPHPDFVVRWEDAQDWLEDGLPVVARTLLRASQARGLVLVQPGEELPVAPLYTLYTKKADEYRVHVVDGVPMSTQIKRRRRGVEQLSRQIRNHNNGWVYCREAVTPPDSVLSAAVAAVDALGLDFGAVDIGYNRHYEQPCVYEVNTAPGLEGSTLNEYAGAFAELVRTRRG